MKFHPEGLEFLKWVGTASLILAAIALRFSSWPGQIFVAILDRVAGNFPPASLDPAAEHRKRQRSRGLSAAQLRKGPRLLDRQEILFDWFLAAVAAYGLLDWLLLPSPYRLADENRWPVLLALFVVGTIIIFIGTETWDERTGWKKWTFWVSVLATVVVVLGVAHWLQPMSIGGVLLALMASAAAFFWLFGTLRRIDRYELEQRRLNGRSDFAGEEAERLKN